MEQLPNWGKSLDAVYVSVILFIATRWNHMQTAFPFYGKPASNLYQLKH